MDPKLKKNLVNWLLKPAIIVAGLAALIWVTDHWLIPGAAVWRDGCRARFGGTWFFDIFLCLGPMGLITLVLFAASWLLFRRYRKKGGSSFPVNAAIAFTAFSLPCWRADWVKRHAVMFQPWVPSVMLAVEILMLLALAALWIGVWLIRASRRTPAERQQKNRRSYRLIGVFLIVFRIALTIGLNCLVWYSIYGAAAGDTTAIVILAALILLCAWGIWGDVRKNRKEKKALREDGGETPPDGPA